MPVFSFTLFVEGVDLRGDDQVDALFEAGCGDALVGLVDGAGRLDFDREAASLEEAVLSAVEDIESVDGAKAVRVADVGPALTPAQRTAAAEPGRAFAARRGVRPRQVAPLRTK